MERNTTGRPCSRGAIVRLEDAWRHPWQPPADPPCSVTDDDKRPRPLLVWHPTLPVGGPVIIWYLSN